MIGIIAAELAYVVGSTTIVWWAITKYAKEYEKPAPLSESYICIKHGDTRVEGHRGSW
ncbi:hypothetical protein ATCVWI0606_260L [Acanthocystis turfacea Chlorella virus WI0606]|nr:hypothetical protein ATCVWI0606_260L [Acanthocystis turfacea Chlorella virus WI0606]